jgi:photosystem II stability/assembly factor-like uncharacterized protein
MKSYKYFFIVLLLFNNIITAQWYQQNSGTTTHLYSVFFIDENTGWTCGDSGKIIKTTNGGLDWLEQNSNTIAYLRVIQFIDHNNGWAYGYHQILNTTNGGTTWNVQDFPPPAYIVALQYINLNTGWFIYHNSDSSYIAKTTNGGNTWTIQFQSQNEDCDAIYFLDENYGWASFIGGVLKTTNGGNSWTEYVANLQGSPMCVKFVDYQTGWIISNTLGSYDISKSTDGGLNWFSQISGPGEFIQSISCLNVNTVYAAGIQPFVDDGFIWKTTDGGASWIEQYRDDGQLNSIFFANDTLGWSVGRGGKILFTENGGVTSVKENSPNPVEFKLSQNYPNPFNPSTKIKFTVPQSPLLEGDGRGGLVTLKVYDVLGNEITTLVNEELSAGEYEVEFVAAGLTSGIYFYQLRIGGPETSLPAGQAGSGQTMIQTRKMVLMR